jgi:anti-anti-sigma regulatory factor
VHGRAHLTLPGTLGKREAGQLARALEVLGMGPLEVVLDGSAVRHISASAAAVLQQAEDKLSHPVARVKIVHPSPALRSALRLPAAETVHLADALDVDRRELQFS